MYLLILFFLITIIIIYIVYRFFPKIDSIIKTYLPSQRVVDIKMEMHSLDIDLKKDSNNDKINEKIYNIAFIPIDYLYRIFNSLFSQLPLKIP